MRSIDQLMRGLLVIGLLAVPVIGQAEQLTGQQFEDRTSGLTLQFLAPDGSWYGAEQYLDNRRVRWMYRDGSCTDGTWFPEGDKICFLYDGQAAHQCWITREQDGQLLAHPADGDPDSAIYSVEESQKPLPCPGPDVGV